MDNENDSVFMFGLCCLNKSSILDANPFLNLSREMIRPDLSSSFDCYFSYKVFVFGA